MENIIISNSSKFEEIKKKIILGGFSNLHILADFDRTLTHAFLENGEEVSSLISILRDENLISEEYSLEAKNLFKKYHPIEVNSEISLEEKRKAMEEWWKKHAELLIRHNLNLNDLKKVAKSSRIRFREKTLETMLLVNNNNVPFVILSASGLGDLSISETLKAHKMYLSTVDIISNQYIYDGNGIAISYKEPLIHTFNKNENSVKQSPYYERVKNRKNVILLGDSLGDVHMIEGFDYNALLKVGFLNSNIEKNLEEYKRHYDIVITNDSSMEFVYDLLKELK